MVINIIISIIVFGLLVIVHEAGHFFVAKSVGIKVNEFAIGMGPVIFKKQKGETEYSLRAIPLGGYVKMEGEDEESSDERSFNSKPAIAKILVLVAGSAMNFIFAIFIIIGLFTFSGFPSNDNIIGDVIAGNPAEKTGIQSGDEIINIEGIEINTWEDIVGAITESTEQQMLITVKRDGEIKEFKTNIIVESDRRMIGIQPVKEYSFTRAIVEGTKYSFMLVGAMLSFFVTLFKGQASSNDVVGPVGIIHLVGEAARMGIVYVANFTAMISMNLAVINLLPFPALDGGRLLLIIAQSITGKKIDPEKEGFIHFVGFVILIGLMIFVTFRDFNRFIF